jgi:hypothetical protein
MAESTTSTFGSNSRVLSVGNGIIFGTSMGGRPAIVTSVSSTGPTKIVYVDDANDPPSTAYSPGGGADIPYDSTPGADASTVAAGYWICVKAPPVR